MPRRANTELEGRVPLTLSVTQEEKKLIEEEAAKSRQTVSALAVRAMMALICAPRLGGVPLLPTTGFMALPVGVDEYIFIPKNWGPEELRRAARFYEGLRDAVPESEET